MLSFQTFSARTGVVETPELFLCNGCTAQTPMLVRAEGFGSSAAATGGSAEAARVAAASDVEARTERAMTMAQCPRCGAHRHDYLVERAADAKEVARRGQLALPIGVALAVATFVGLYEPAMRDIRHSLSLAGVAVAAAFAMFGFATAFFHRPAPEDRAPLADVYFWLETVAGPAWVRSALSPAPPSPTSRSGRVLGLVVGACGVAGTLVGLFAYAASFQRVYVVDADAVSVAEGWELRVDDAWNGGAKVSTSGDAVTWEIELRTDADHTVELVGPGGETRGRYSLGEARHGWVVVTGQRALDLCLAEIPVTYGRASADGRVTRPVARGEGVLPLGRGYDAILGTPSVSKKLSADGLGRKWTLRGLRCPLDAEEEPRVYRTGAAL